MKAKNLPFILVGLAALLFAVALFAGPRPPASLSGSDHALSNATQRMPTLDALDSGNGAASDMDDDDDDGDGTKLCPDSESLPEDASGPALDDPQSPGLTDRADFVTLPPASPLAGHALRQRIFKKTR